MKKISFLLLFTIYTEHLYAEISPNWLTNNIFNVREIQIKKEMATTLQFDSIIDNFVVGSVEAVDVTYLNNYSLVLYANNINRITNLNVTTREGNYVFVIRTFDINSKIEPNLHINIGKLSTQNLTLLHKKIKKQEVETLFNPDFDYSFEMKTPHICKKRKCNYKKIAPNKVWTDGKYTYLDYRTADGSEKSIPLVQQTLNNIDTPVQFDVKENIIVIKALVKNITLSSNGEYVCVTYIGKKYEVF